MWIPVGEYKVSTTLSPTGTLKNNLTRRTFTDSGPTEVKGDVAINTYYYGEGDSRSVAYDTINDFIASASQKSEENVNGHGGFYIGRYEQGENNVCKAGVNPYVSVTRDQAKTQAESMYSGNTYVTSELISSYAWDTALNFICQTNEEGYLLAITTDSTYGNIGTSSLTQTGGYIADKYSNICDFLGNRREWTTEYSSFSASDSFCVGRGGDCYGSSVYAAYRDNFTTNYSFGYLGFRSQLYL